MICPRCERTLSSSTPTIKYCYDGKLIEEQQAEHLQVYNCECGLELNSSTAHIMIGKYSITFVKAATYICWNEPTMVKTLDICATDEKLSSLFGEDWIHIPNINTSQHRVYFDEEIPNQQSIRIPSLRYKITLEDIEKLMVLK